MAFGTAETPVPEHSGPVREGAREGSHPPVPAAQEQQLGTCSDLRRLEMWETVLLTWMHEVPSRGWTRPGWPRKLKGHEWAGRHVE